MSSESRAPAPTAAAPEGWLGRFLLWLLLGLAIVSMPRYPAPELDSSWRMALGWFFHQGLQVGRDVVFTYGPLGYLMGRTYSGLQFGSLVLWQLVAGAIFAAVIMANSRDLRGLGRFIYFLFFLLLGVIYEDALHMIIIALLGWGLVRRVAEPARASTPLLALLLAVLAIIKFTNLMLAAFCVAVACGYALWLRRRSAAWSLAGWFCGGYLLLWILCGQNPLNLPLYLYNSWDVSQGYQEAMGLPTPPAALWKGVTVLLLLVVYALAYLWLHPDRPRSVALAAVLGAFIYLNWKHGFVRSDGHMIGFFICALVPIVAFPSLLQDGPRLRWLQRLLLIPAGILCLAGIETALPGVVRQAAGQLQDKVWTNLSNVAHWSSYRKSFDARLREQKQAADLPRVRTTVGNATIDVLGFEQAVALLNGLNYHPRPVFQSYMVYTPRLARLNEEFYTSERAPEFALLKIQTIDERLPALDDSRLLNVFVHDYEYVLAEKGWQLWRRRGSRPDPATLAPRRVKTVATTLGASCALGDMADRPTWVTVELPYSLLGRLRDVVYKAPFVKLIIEQQDGRRREFRLPLLQGRAGFILNPAVEDLADYMNFAGGRPTRWVRSVTVAVAQGDRLFFADRARLSFYALTPSTAGAAFFQQATQERFRMFKSYPVTFSAYTDPSEAEIDGEKAIVLHAPSEMEFILPPGAREISGAFGYVPGAYQSGGRTDGAVFQVVWTNGSEQTVVYSRRLNPRDNPEDRGLQRFRADLKDFPGGQLRLEVNPGPNNDNSWDWTAWTGIEIK